MRGVYGRELMGQRGARRRVRVILTTRGANDTNARAEYNDSGEKEERLAFRGGRHEGKMHRPLPSRAITVLRGKSKANVEAAGEANAEDAENLKIRWDQIRWGLTP